MENDKQMNDFYLEKVKNIFLSDDLLAKDAKPEVYSLAEEFSKSKKNKAVLVYALIFLYVAVIGFSVFFLTTIEENKNKRIEVNIAEFRQFNLMELLAEKKENEEKLAQLQLELEEFRKQAMEEIKKLSPREQQKAIAALNEKMKTLEADYLQQIKDKEAALAALEKSIAAEKQKIAASAQENEAVIKNYQNLSQMQQVENEQLKIEYEGKIAKLNADYRAEIELLKKDNQILIEELTLRYNPKFTRGEIAAAINSKLGNVKDNTRNRYNRILADEGILNEQEYNQIHKKVQNQTIILKGLEDVGYLNSVPLALDKLGQLSRSVVADYEKLWGKLVELIQEKNEAINSYEYALKYLAMTGRETGYVIDARNPNRLIIFIDQIYSVRKGDFAYIFKDDATPIAKIELNPEKGRITAIVKEVLKPVKIEPFDKILLKLEVAK
ncbi:MAG: hypothetical protein ACM3YE_01395 [Bacteroidota bacterium]